MADQLKDLNAAARMKEAIARVVQGVLTDEMPKPRYATVTAVNHATGTATVQYPDDAATFTVPTSVVAPNAAGALVRVAGFGGGRYIDEIMSGAVRLRGAGTVLQLQTTDASSAAIDIDASSHATSERAAINIGDWIVGQDVGQTGAKDFFVWNGVNRLAIAAGGDVTLNNALFTEGSVKVGFSPAHGTSYSGLHYGSNYVIMSNAGVDTFVGTNNSGGSIRLRPGVNNAARELTVAASGSHSLAGAGLTLNGNALVCGNINGARIQGDLATGATAAWTALQFAANGDNGGSNTAGITLYTGAYAPIMVQHDSTGGEAIEFRSNGDGGYINIFAAAFTPSSIELKQDIQDEDNISILDRIESIGPLQRYRMKARPTNLRNNDKFTDINERWIARGKSPLFATQDHKISVEHDCALDGCTGTATEPCNVMVSDTEQLGHIAEIVHPIFPEWTHLDVNMRPMGFHLGQQAATALDGVRTLWQITKWQAAEIQELREQIQALASPA